jgi:hypothetical protein
MCAIERSSSATRDSGARWSLGSNLKAQQNENRNPFPQCMLLASRIPVCGGLSAFFGFKTKAVIPLTALCRRVQGGQLFSALGDVASRYADGMQMVCKTNKLLKTMKRLFELSWPKR